MFGFCQEIWRELQLLRWCLRPLNQESWKYAHIYLYTAWASTGYIYIVTCVHVVLPSKDVQNEQSK